ncbi:hypothetical protein [Salipaludibacillus daqingensis]|uniref:hypothetical protein n=1 Tax=Salipaludibacillus daqingensis TaxID=3041001 RepID=UPI002474D0E7|nr:hypothetical protein [Salipaludibacillus daqingensis]
MDRKLSIPLNVFASFLLLFVFVYYGYYVYIGVMWGYSERMLMLLVSDGVFWLFVPAAIGIFRREKWSWWLTISVFVQLFIAKIIAIAANVFLLVSGNVAEPLQGSNMAIEFLYLVLYLIIIVSLSLEPIRKFSNVNKSFLEAFWRVFLLAIGIYVIHFILTVVAITAIQPT